MKPHRRTIEARLLKRLALPVLCAGLLLCPKPAGAYSVLSHEEVVDMAWQDRIVPMLRARFPGISPDDIRQAHAYAYGGSVIQDIGYYPFGSHYFSDLLHYVRPNEFVVALIRDSKTPNEYAFALGALAHYCGDIIGHPAINQVVAEENPPLEHRFGQAVTYAQDPTAHIRTEFGFDIVEVAQGHYTQENYRDFIGFQVAKPLLEQAFQETYGIPVSSILKHEDLAIGTYRRAVSSIIPSMTKIAFVTYKNQIQQASPGIEKRKFLYRLKSTEYEKTFGTDYYHVGFGGRISAFFLQIVPKVGPFKALKVSVPDARAQDIYLKSINTTVDRFRLYLSQIHAAPAPLPPPSPQSAEDARKAAEKISKDALAVKRTADAAQDPARKASLEQTAAKVQQLADHVTADADRTQARVAALNSAEPAPPPPRALPPDTPIQPPSTPRMPELDLDTGQPSAVGEYVLADKTYARLLAELIKTPTASGHPDVAPAVAADIERFFARPAKPTLLPTAHQSQQQSQQAAQLQANLATLKSLRATPQ